MKASVSTTDAPAAVGPYSQAISSGELVFCSGQAPLDPDSGAVIEGDVAAQTERVMTNLRSVLRAAGLDLDDVVKTTCFLRDMNDFAAFNEVYARFFSEPFPARSTIQAARLPLDIDVEVEAIARRP